MCKFVGGGGYFKEIQNGCNVLILNVFQCYYIFSTRYTDLYELSATYIVIHYCTNVLYYYFPALKYPFELHVENIFEFLLL